MLRSLVSSRSRLLALLLAPLLLASCGDGDGPTDTDDVAGTYALVQVNGQNVPSTFYEDNAVKIEILGGSLVLGSDETYREPINFRVTEKSSNQVVTASEEDTGTYKVSGNTITFTSSNAEFGTYEGTVSGNTISYTAEGISVTYRK